jgi:hypothetical protein
MSLPEGDPTPSQKAGESRHISRGRLLRNGADCGLNRSNRAFLFRACYLPDISLLSVNNLPVIFLFRGRRPGAPYFSNHLKRIFFGGRGTSRPRSEQGEKAL